MPIDHLDGFSQSDLIKNSRHFEVETRLSEETDDGRSDLLIHSVFSPEHDVILNIKKDGRLYFTDDEIKNNEKVAIVSPDLGRLGDRITLGTLGEFAVVGVLDTIIPSTAYIPCSLYVDRNLTVNTMHFVVRNRLDLKEIKGLEDYFYADDDVLIVQGPAPTLNSMIDDLLNWTISFFIIILLIFILFLFFAQYMSEKNKRIYSILGILGENKAEILFLLIAERCFMVLSSMCIASVIHFFIRDGLHKILTLPDCRMIFSDYAAVIFMAVLASLIVSAPYALSYLFKQYTVQLKQSE